MLILDCWLKLYKTYLCKYFFEKQIFEWIKISFHQPHIHVAFRYMVHCSSYLMQIFLNWSPLLNIVWFSV